MMMFELHAGTSVESSQSPEQRLQGIRIQKWMIVLDTGHVDRELKICKKEKKSESISAQTENSYFIHRMENKYNYVPFPVLLSAA